MCSCAPSTVLLQGGPPFRSVGEVSVAVEEVVFDRFWLSAGCAKASDLGVFHPAVVGVECDVP